MNEPLRPLNLGEILDRTLQFYRARAYTGAWPGRQHGNPGSDLALTEDR